MKTFKKLLVGGVALTSFVGLAAPVGAHTLGHDSVDGCEIRDEDETSYDAERTYARNAWEARKNLTVTGASKVDNCVDIEPDSWDVVADLEWKTANRSDVSWAGLYQWEPGADDIHLNAYYMNQYSSCRRQNVAMHELGHAHGLGHSFVGQVMNSYAQSICTLQSHDRSDYHALWG